ncbi:hypothetical protein [Helicobacter pylori]|uniref:hypothetical protein n=1 Tax=Helicobacter pylori TaxID=210 RepID=UPI003D698C8E
MRQKNETATIFNQFKEITQIMQAQKTPTPKSENAEANEPTQKSTLKPKTSARAKNHALKPTKRAFSERQITTIRDKSQTSDNASLENKASNHANAFKSDEAKERGQQ